MQLTGLIFLEKDRLWFGIYNSYAIKRIMRLSDMQLTRFVCTTFRYTGKLELLIELDSCTNWLKSDRDFLDTAEGGMYNNV